MKIAVFGATGAVGSTLLVHMLKGSTLRAGDEIVLVGRGTRSSEAHLLAIQSDLMDAFDTGVLTITLCEVMNHLPPVDVFVMCAGETINKRYPTRQDLGPANSFVFQDTASVLSRRAPNCIVIIVSNPVELAVMIFARYLPRKQVVGMGAQQDSQRFARAVAAHLQLPRASVRASVVGEHGPGMIPLWTSVHLVDADVGLLIQLSEIRSKFESSDLAQALSESDLVASDSLPDEEVSAAYQTLASVSPVIRVKIEPLLTRRLLHSTPNATANATMDCIQALLESDDRRIHGQVLLDGEFERIHGVFGAPLALRRSGWAVNTLEPLSAAERSCIRDVSVRLNNCYSEFLAGHRFDDAVHNPSKKEDL